MANKIFHGVESTFGGAINMSGGVQFQLGSYGQPGLLANWGFQKEQQFDSTSNLAVQNAQVRAQRPLQQFYDLFSTNVYYVMGRAQAQCSMDRILGPANSMANLYAKMSDPCLIGKNAALLELKGEFCQNKGITGTQKAVDMLAGGNKLILNNCAMDNVSIAMRAQDFLFTEQFSFNATDLLTDR